MYLTFRHCISGRPRGSLIMLINIYQRVFNNAFKYISESLIMFKDISHLIFLVSSK